MFLSGSVKLLSGDPTWANLSALSYHFQTQPLPTRWPGTPSIACRGGVLKASTAATFVIELGAAVFDFLPAATLRLH